MNESGSDSEEKIPARYLQCGICKQQYGGGERSPRVLPCLHSCCLSCLELGWDWAASRVTCQVCKTTWDVNNTVSDTFPMNFVAMKLLTLAKVENSRTVQCTDCVESKTATHRCVECQHFLCPDGYKAHKQFLQLKSHRVLGIAEFLKSPTEMFPKEDLCDVHHGQPRDLFCLSDTCKSAICWSCALVSHIEREGHCLGKIQEVYKEQWSMVREQVEDILIRLEEYRDDVHSYEEHLKKLQGREKDVKADISKVFEELMEALRTRRDVLLKTVDDLTEKQRADFDVIKSESRTSERKIKDAVEYANQTLSVCSYAEFLSLSPLLKEALRSLQNNSGLLKYVEKNIHLNYNHLDDLKRHISKFGDITENFFNSYAWKPVVEVVDSHPGHEANIMEIKFINDINKMAASEVPKVEVKVERCEPPTGPRVLRMQSHGENRKLGYQVKFTPPREVMYKTKLKIGTMRLTQRVFKFRCKEERVDGRDRKLYIAQKLLGDHDKWDFLEIRCPHIRLSDESLNRDWCRLREKVVLINKPSVRKVEESPLVLKSYPGAVATIPLHEDGRCYWEIQCKTQVKQRWWGSILEAGIARRTAIDSPYIVGYSQYGWTLQIVYCTVHRGVCAQARNNRQTLYDLPLSMDDLENVLDVHVGFLMDFVTGSLHVIDVVQGRLLYTFTDVECSKQLWPFCGIFNNNWYSTELRVLSGADVILGDQHLRLLESLCDAE